MQLEKPEDFVLATGRKITVRRFVEMAFAEAGISVTWSGKGKQEKGTNKETGKVIVEIDENYYRPTEVDKLIGDASKAKKMLGWAPKHTVEDLVKEMMASDMRLFERDKYLMDGGHDIISGNE
jgi:GDPmannose 4,6-dehydratase